MLYLQNLVYLKPFSDPVGQTNCQIVLSLTYLLVVLGKAVDIKSCLIKAVEDVGLPGWSDCLDKRQVGDQLQQIYI